MSANTSIPSAGPGGDQRPITAGSWTAAFAGGLVKVAIAALALTLPLIENHTLPLWVGAMLLAGGLAELAVGRAGRHSVVGKVALASGTMTALTGVIFMAAVGMGLGQLSLLTTVWLVLRGLISLLLALPWRSSHAARTLLVVRGVTDLALGAALIAGLSISQITLLVFGGTAELTTGFLVLVAISFGVAGAGLIAIALSERRWERRHPGAATRG